MITIDFLKHQPDAILPLSKLWKHLIGDVWAPDVSEASVVERFKTHLNLDAPPLTYVAFHDGTPIGMCSLRTHEAICPDLTPWLGSLIVDPNFQSLGVGQRLIRAILDKAKAMEYEHVYLFTFDPTLPEYYAQLGWKTIGIETLNGHRVTVMSITL